MLKTDNLDESKTKESLNASYNSATDLMQMINRLLNLNRIRLHKLKVNLAPVLPLSVCHKIIEGYQVANTNPNLRFIHVKKGSVPVVNLDESLVEEVIFNLLNNSSKFTESGDISLSVKNNEDNIVFSVSDDGPGIKKEDLHKIFKKFSQTSDGSDKKYSLGIGLFVSKNIVEAHHGMIWVESEYGKGSTFYFSIPKVQSNSVKWLKRD